MELAMILLGLGLLALLYFALQLKMEIRHTTTTHEQAIAQIQFQIQDQQSKWISTARSAGRSPALGTSNRTEVLFPSSPKHRIQAAQWTDSTRGKAIEMVRRGETPQSIVAALPIGKPEVEFLMRLEKANRKA